MNDLSSRFAVAPKVTITGTLVGVFRPGEHSETSECEGVTVDLEGIVPVSNHGIRNRGWTRIADQRTPWYDPGRVIRNRRQITIVSQEELTQITDEMGLPEIQPQWIGSNLYVSGVRDLSMLPRGTRVRIGSATLLVEDQNAPCIGSARLVGKHYPDQLRRIEKAFVKACFRRRGLLCSVEAAGAFSRDESISFELPEQWMYSA